LAFAGISQERCGVRGTTERRVRVAPGGIEGLETRGELGGEDGTRGTKCLRQLGPNATLEAMKETVPNMTLPGADLIERGIEDLRARRESAEALLVSIGAPRLRSVGASMPAPIASPEHKLYALLAREHGDGAHSAYNALIRRLVSFERAAECAS
jgi:hypothetical protein